MAKLTKHIIKGDTPSSQFELPVYEFGTPSNGPKIYLQAGMHADEHPGMLVLHHLMNQLEAAEEKGILQAHFTILPVVNPLGLSHLSFHTHRGRYHPVIGLNYNRNWPDFGAILQSQDGFAAGLGNEADANKAHIRQHMRQWLDAANPVTALDHQRHLVMSHCYDADMILDLHCDDIASNHIFVIPQNMPRYQSLADRMGSVATLTAENSGGGSFDEVWSALMVTLAKAFPDTPFPDPILSATLEYRGQQDVFDHVNKQDAMNLYDFFCDEGLIADTPSCAAVPASPPTPLDACDIVRVQEAGLIAYHVALGDQVKKGDVIAELIALDGPEPALSRQPIYAGTDGVIFSLMQMKYVWPGTSIAKIAGTQSLASRQGYLLED